MNRVLLVGRLVRDPELQSTGTTQFTNFTMAVNRAVANKCDFFDCVAFNKRAEIITQYCHKGDIVGIDGKLQARTFEGKHGETVKKIEVVVDNVSFFPRQQKQDTGYMDKSGQKIEISEEDLPF